MCVVSMISGWKQDDWNHRYPWIVNPPMQPGFIPPAVPAPTPQEIAEFRELLERAREYDKRNNEPHCEQDEKRKALLEMAKQLGVDISFI